VTGREGEVLRLLAQSLDQETIAQKLVLSPKTVATHIQRILPKLGVSSWAQAVALAYREGLVADGDTQGVKRASRARAAPLPLNEDQGAREVAGGERAQVLHTLPDTDELHG
jgi:DNA-binding CsgD family transcriptional regulator